LSRASFARRRRRKNCIVRAFDHDKYLTKMCDYKGTTKNGQMKTTYLIEVVVLHAAGDAK
jgi:hypothetical protein